MKVALTGTPGTGKTTISNHLEGFEVVHLTEYMREKGIGEQKEELQVRPEKLRKIISAEFDDGENVVFEGHLSHHLDVDYCIVLRCNPDELGKRLSKRSYTPQKIHENVESEVIDIILQEAVHNQEKVFEIDTTGNNVDETVELVKDAIEKEKTGYGNVDWTGSL